MNKLNMNELLQSNDPAFELYYYAKNVIKKRLPKEYEDIILKTGTIRIICLYIFRVIKGRWPEVEPTIMEDPESAYDYARLIIKDRWPEAEPYIKKNIGYYKQYYDEFIRGKILKSDNELKKMTKRKRAEYLYDYAINSKSRKRLDKKYEDIIKIFPDTAYQYARNIIKGRWKEAEEFIIKNPEWAYKYARSVIKGRWRKAEEYIMKDRCYIYKYALNIIGGRWKEAESIIKQNACDAYQYIRDIVGKRVKEVESVIMEDPQYAYLYAKNIIKGRWKEAEPYILKNLDCAYDYAEYIIKDRWLEIEKYIIEDNYLTYSYCNKFNITPKDILLSLKGEYHETAKD